MKEEAGKSKSGGSYGVQSAETVLEVLSSFVGAGPMPMLKTIAERTGMHPAKVHRYLVSLCRLGYVEQDEMTSRYRLGPASLKLAFAAMNSIDALRVARPMMASFCQRIQEAVVLGIWNAGGPTVAIRETLPGLLTISATEGVVLPIIRSSIGAVFGAWLPREKTQAHIDAELAALDAAPQPDSPSTMAGVEALFEDVRRRGLARTTGQFSPGTHSFAAPVFDASGQLAAVLAAIGPASQFDSRWGSETAKKVLECAGELSRSLGHYEGRY